MVALAGLVALSLARQGGLGALAVIWAEDGSVFLFQALQEPLADTVPQAYAGYLHLLPRVGGAVAVAVGLPHAAETLALIGAAATAVSAMVVYAASAGHVRAPALRGLVAALLVLQPVAIFESLNSIALAQWHLAGAAVWVALWRPRRWAGALFASAFLVVTVLSAPLALGLAPVLALRLLLTRSWRDRLPVLAFTLAAAVQILALVSQPAPNQPGGDVGTVLAAYAELVARPAVFGPGFGAALTSAGAPAGMVALALVCSALLIGLATRRWAAVIYLAVASVSTFTATVLVRGAGDAMSASDGAAVFGGSRFVVVPAFLLLGLLVVALDGWLDRAPASWRQPLVALCTGAALLVAGTSLRVDNDRGMGPAWQPQIEAAARACEQGVTHARFQASPPVPSFNFLVACERVEASLAP